MNRRGFLQGLCAALVGATVLTPAALFERHPEARSLPWIYRELPVALPKNSTFRLDLKFGTPATLIENPEKFMVRVNLLGKLEPEDIIQTDPPMKPGERPRWKDKTDG